MLPSKNLVTEVLWNELEKKVAAEWNEKFSKHFGEFKGLSEFPSPHNFAVFIRLDMLSYFEAKSAKFKVVSESALSDIFHRKSISERTHDKTLDTISFYIGYNSWLDFYKKTMISIDLKKTNAHINVSLEDQKNNSIEDYFIYYYIDTSFKPDKCLLTTSDKKFKLTFYKRDINGQNLPSITYSGPKYFNPTTNVLSFNVTHEIIADKEVITSNPSFCSFEITGNDIFPGVFAASGKTISCGIVVLERTTNSEYYRFINSVHIPPKIYSIIYNARLVATGYRRKDDFLLKKDEILNIAIEYFGVYEGFTLITQGGLAIQRLVFEIFENGDVKFKSFGRPNGIDGRIMDIRNYKNLVMQFGLNRVHNYYKIQIVFDLQKGMLVLNGHSKVLIGIFGGIEESSESPMAGRIILFPTDKLYKDIEVDIIPLSDEVKISQLFTDEYPKKKGLKKFFRGELDEFVDPPHILERSIFSNRPTDKNKDLE